MSSIGFGFLIGIMIRSAMFSETRVIYAQNLCWFMSQPHEPARSVTNRQVAPHAAYSFALRGHVGTLQMHVQLGTTSSQKLAEGPKIDLSFVVDTTGTSAV